MSTKVNKYDLTETPDMTSIMNNKDIMKECGMLGAALLQNIHDELQKKEKIVHKDSTDWVCKSSNDYAEDLYIDPKSIGVGLKRLLADGYVWTIKAKNAANNFPINAYTINYEALKKWM